MIGVIDTLAMSSAASSLHEHVILRGTSRRLRMIPQEHIGELAAKSIVTRESLDNNDQHPVVEAWIEHQLPQCGYCETGQITQAISLISRISKRTDERIN